MRVAAKAATVFFVNPQGKNVKYSIYHPVTYWYKLVPYTVQDVAVVVLLV